MAAAKSLQSCPTLCDPIDGSAPVSPIPGILQARTLEWIAISFSNAWKWKVKAKSLSRVWLLAPLWTAAYQAPPSMGFSRQEYWSGLPLPSPLYGKALNIDSTSALSFPKHNKHQVRYLQNFTSLRLSHVNCNAKENKIQNKKSVLIEPNIILLPIIFPTISPLSLPTPSYPLCWACPVFQALDHLLIL